MCRSPMAEGLAWEVFDGWDVESAGISPLYTGATTEAIQVMHEEYAIDISEHKSKSIYDVPIKDFDLIVGMTREICETLRNDPLDIDDKLICWKIADPYREGVDAFKRCAEKIKVNVDKLKASQS